jgi:molybdopterin synthase catalytic subunit
LAALLRKAGAHFFARCSRPAANSSIDIAQQDAKVPEGSKRAFARRVAANKLSPNKLALQAEQIRQMLRPTIRVQTEDFDAAAESAALTAGRTDIGALVSFVGLCRDEAGVLEALELEHYPGMAEEEIARIVEAAGRRWPLLGVTVIHRTGNIRPGEQIVLALCASAHRGAAFAAAEFLMDFLKSRAPFWKKEHRADGTRGDWVEAKDADEAALERWSRRD